MDTFNSKKCSSDDISVEEELKQRLTKLAGSRTSELLQSVKSASNMLQSNDPSIRQAAIQALATYWNIRPWTKYAKSLREMAKNDKNYEVRCESLSWLGYIYAGTDDVEVGKVLADTVLNESEKIGTRKKAYDGLCWLRWHGKATWALCPFPEGVDWSYVNSFLDVSRKPNPIDLKTNPLEVMKRISMQSSGIEEKTVTDITNMLNTGAYEEVITSATNALKSDIGHACKAFIHIIRAKALIELGDLRDAVRDLSNAIELDSNRTTAYKKRADIYNIMGDSKKAEDDLQRVRIIGD